MTPLATLADRVEGAEGPSRELDAEIQRALGFDPEPGWAPAYSASLDAAMGLVSDVMYRSGHDGSGPDPALFFCEAITPAPECHHVRAVAATEPLARTACFLRARNASA